MNNLLEALRTTVLGMGTVFATLYILSLILDLMRFIFNPNKVKKNPNKSTDNKVAETAPAKETTETNDSELVAVITAALSSYLGKPSSQIKIGSIRQLYKNTPVWGMAARLEKSRLN
jgi:sodium pump decarboxylase gamma subunit